MRATLSISSSSLFCLSIKASKVSCSTTGAAGKELGAELGADATDGLAAGPGAGVEAGVRVWLWGGAGEGSGDGVRGRTPSSFKASVQDNQQMFLGSGERLAYYWICT